MARNCAKKPHQNSTKTRLRKQPPSQPAKVPHLGAACNSPALSLTTAHLRPYEAISPLAQKAYSRSASATGLADRKPTKAPLASDHHGHKKPRRPFSPPTKRPALPQPLGQAAQLPQRRLHGCGKGHAHLTAPQPQTRPRLIFKVPCSSDHTTAQLARYGSANRFRCPKIIWSRRFYFLFSPSARFLLLPLAQRGRQRHGVFSQNHCWRRYTAFKPPTLPHGEAVSAARGVGWIELT